MPPKRQAVAGNAKKAENEKVKKDASQKLVDKAEDEDWAKGNKKAGGKGEDKAAAAALALKRKQDNAKALEAEEKSDPKHKVAAPKVVKKVVPAKMPVMKSIPTFESSLDEEPTEFSASGIDSALDLLSLVTEKTDKASIGSKAAKIEQHPERRFKAAFEAYKDEQLPIIRKERPGMRLQQYHDALYKDFQKSPDNPFNQISIAYDATKEEKVAALSSARAKLQERLRAD